MSFDQAVRLTDIDDGKYVEGRAGKCPILIARFGEEVFAVEDQCSHADSPLAGGRLRNGRIMCPLHGANFDFRTGRAIGGGFAPCGLRTFRTRIVGEWVEIDPQPVAGLPR